MSLEALNTTATLGTFVVIAAKPIPAAFAGSTCPIGGEKRTKGTRWKAARASGPQLA